MNSQSAGNFIDDPIIAMNDLSNFIISPYLGNHSTNPGISFEMFCYINNPFESQGSIFD